MTYYVQHRTASGSLTQSWEYDARERRVHVSLRVGLVIVGFSVAVCHGQRPRTGAHSIVRLDGETFRVLPARFVQSFQHRRAQLEPIACTVAEILAPGASLVLQQAPHHVSAEIDLL